MYGDDQQFGGGDAFGGGGGGQFGGDTFGGGAAQAFSGSQFQAPASQNAGGGFQVDNSTPDGGKTKKNSQSLVPTTIKQLHNAPANANGEQGFQIDGRELHQVTIVGIITSADEQQTNLQYTVDDGTGSIVAKMWVDAEQDAAMQERRAEWKEGKMVRVVGQLRVFNHTRSVVAFTIQPIKDFNEYSYHFIECVHTHLHLTKGKAPAGAGAMGAASGMQSMGGAQPMQTTGGFGAAPQAASNANLLQDTVLGFFKDCADSEVGSTVDECFNAVSAHGATQQQIRDLVEHLTSEGHLYSTIDDNHFKGT